MGLEGTFQVKPWESKKGYVRRSKGVRWRWAYSTPVFARPGPGPGAAGGVTWREHLAGTPHPPGRAGSSPRVSPAANERLRRAGPARGGAAIVRFNLRQDPRAGWCGCCWPRPSAESGILTQPRGRPGGHREERARGQLAFVCRCVRR